jgi:hypothetical protein
MPRPGGALELRSLDKRGHQIAFPLGLRPALGVRVRHVEILVLVTRPSQAFLLAVALALI